MEAFEIVIPAEAGIQKKAIELQKFSGSGTGNSVLAENLGVIHKKVGHFQMHAAKPWGSGLNK